MLLCLLTVLVTFNIITHGGASLQYHREGQTCAGCIEPKKKSEMPKFLSSAVDKGIEMLNKKEKENGYAFEKASIIKWSSQVVQGLLYRVTVDVKCKKKMDDEQKVDAKCADRTCIVSLWSRPWLDEQEKAIVNIEKCEMKKRKPNNV